MARDNAEILEMVATFLDRLPEEFPGAIIEDAILMVELTDPTDKIVLDDSTGREVAPSIVMVESTTNRLTVQMGIVEFARENLGMREADED